MIRDSYILVCSIYCRSSYFKHDCKLIGDIDIKLSNVLVNYGCTNIRFTDVQLADFGSTVNINSSFAQNGDSIGTPIFRSPEAQLQMKWSTETDIWSFGAMVSVILPFS